MLPVDFLLMVNSIRGRILHIVCDTFFCVKRQKIAISEDRVMRKRPFIRSRSSKVDFGTNRKRVYTFLLVINNYFSHILHRFGDMAA